MARRIIRLILFIAFFFIFAAVLAFFLKDDSNSYARVLRHEFYRQQNIDYLFCGASHTSHGINPRIADLSFNKNVFNAGTPAQQIDGTVAVLKQAVKLYSIEKVFMEMDFGIITSYGIKERPGHTADYIVLDFLRDPLIKLDYMLKMTVPAYYLNSILPIGKDKLMDLDPKKVSAKIKSVITGRYFKYEFGDEKSSYAGKGCVLDSESISDGSFSSDSFEEPIGPQNIHPDIISCLNQIVEICRKNNIELIFYSMPYSDFYLNEKGDYDQYLNFCRNFATQNGCPYYDFNLCREKYFSLCDHDFSDDNHLNQSGIEKYTEIFCSFFTGKIPEDELFYASYADKMASISERIFGLVLITSQDQKSLTVYPVTNCRDKSRITYDFYAVSDGKLNPLALNTSSTTVGFPGAGFGMLKITARLDGQITNAVSRAYFSY